MDKQGRIGSIRTNKNCETVCTCCIVVYVVTALLAQARALA